jgi:uncharacterized HAD superfamily protein
MAKIILGLDLDGVLVDWHSAVYTLWQYEHKYNGTYEEFWLEYIPNLSKEKQDYIVTLPIPYETQIPRKSVIDFLDFAKDNADIYYITHRPLEIERVTRQYFKRYNFPYPDNLFMTGDKVTACRYLGVTHFLDDFANQVEKVSAVADAYLFAKPWNREFRDKYKTVYSLKEFKEKVFV